MAKKLTPTERRQLAGIVQAVNRAVGFRGYSATMVSPQQVAAQQLRRVLRRFVAAVRSAPDGARVVVTSSDCWPEVTREARKRIGAAGWRVVGLVCGDSAKVVVVAEPLASA